MIFLNAMAHHMGFNAESNVTIAVNVFDEKNISEVTFKFLDILLREVKKSKSSRVRFGSG